jgi:hypothetical protein
MQSVIWKAIWRCFSGAKWRESGAHSPFGQWNWGAKAGLRCSKTTFGTLVHRSEGRFWALIRSSQSADANRKREHGAASAASITDADVNERFSTGWAVFETTGIRFG